MPSRADTASPSADGPVERIGRIAEVIEKIGCGQRGARAAHARGRRQAARAAAVSHAAAARLRRRRGRPGTWFRAMEALAKLDASTAWCVGQINGCAATASALEPAVAREIWGEPRAALSWGPPDQVARRRGRRRPPAERRVDDVERQPARDLDRPHGAGIRQSGAPVPPPEGVHRCIFFVPADAGRMGRQLERHRPQRHQQRRLQGRRICSCPRATRPTGSISSTCARRPALQIPPEQLFRGRLLRASPSASPARCWMPALRSPEKKPRRGQGTRLRDNHLVQFQIGEAEARLRSARGYVEATAQRVWRRGRRVRAS